MTVELPARRVNGNVGYGSTETLAMGPDRDMALSPLSLSQNRTLAAHSGWLHVAERRWVTVSRSLAVQRLGEARPGH